MLDDEDIQSHKYSLSADFTPGPEDTMVNKKLSSRAYILGRVGRGRTNTYMSNILTGLGLNRGSATY